MVKLYLMLMTVDPAQFPPNLQANCSIRCGRWLASPKARVHKMTAVLKTKAALAE
jgi:hypothetical protein